ncbi:MAG TPA: S9 family peptidase, partial [Vicinamibacteria bacterium]|nr:S9 family peptidase [Vicinamibacteria bacterium]
KEPVMLQLAALVFLAAADGHRPIRETDLYRFVWVADPQISPDGRQVAFVRVTVNEKKDGYESAIWMVPADGSAAPRSFTGGPQDLSPRWSPDGRRIAFTRALEKEGKPQPGQLWVIAAGGGEARVLTDVPKGASSPLWSPDGGRLAFSSTANAKDLARQKKKPGEEDEPESDVRVITRAVYRFNGRGYLDPDRPAHLWTVEAAATTPAPAPKQVTSGEFDESNAAWSADGALLYFTSNRVKEAYYEQPDADLYSVPAGGGEPTRVASIEGSIGEFSLSPDGRRIAFRGTENGRPARSFNQPDLFVVDARPGSQPRNLTTAYDFDIGGGLTGDQHAPRGALPTRPLWSSDGASVLVSTSENGRANLKRVDVASGRVQTLLPGNHEVVAYTASRDAARLAVVLSTPTLVGDVFALDAGASAPRQLTRVNDELFAELTVTEPEEITYPSFDGRKIQAWVQKPPGFDPSKKYPLILSIHGGPHAAYGYTFDHEFQWMAARGYVVLYPNPRGSSAYGQEFANVIQYHYPGDDYKDLMAGVDELIRRGYVAEKSLGVTGGSGGGILTNWTITQTDRFAAAVAQRSIADWSAFWYTADFTLFQPSWFKDAPWRETKDFAERSPITHIEKVKTPLMLIEGEADYRTPPTAGGEQMFRALKYLKKPVVMVRFPEESHELSRSGKPRHRVERLQHILGWFDRYLQGAQVAYDVP